MKTFCTILILACALASTSLVRAEATDNHVLHAVPAPGKIAIDGSLAEWDTSGRIPICSDIDLGWGKFSAWVSMMYDEQALYVGVDWCDPTPMVNDYNPDLDIDRRKCFHSDSLHLHFRTDMQRNLVGWWFGREKRPGAIAVDGWMPWNKQPIVYIDALKQLGVTQAFAVKLDGTGYTQEMRIPWTAIVQSGRVYHAGESFECMADLVWGPDSGKGWPVNHMMDLVKPGAAHNGWFWEVPEIYGKVELSATGHLDLPSPAFLNRSSEQKTKIAGTIPLRTSLPAGDAVSFTLAVNDEAGHRVRSLPGDCRIEDYRVAGDPTKVEVLWDGLDDRGKLAPPGKYQIVGITRGAITPIYDQCFYNPGTPPWATADGTGAWGADHSPPVAVATAGDGVLLGWRGAEGGSGLIGVGPDGRKKWGQSQGVTALAGDDKFAYFMLNDDWAGKRGLARLSRTDGTYQPFTVDGKPLLPVPLEIIFNGRPPGEVRAIAVRQGQLILAMSGNALAFLDASTTKLLKTLNVKDPTELAFAPDGTLFAICAGELVSIDLTIGATAPYQTPGVANAGALTVDLDGNPLIYDSGPDSQIKAFSRKGELRYTAGIKGGRPIRGTFDPQAMSHVRSIAVDARGQIWAVESWEYPRRVSVWGRDGKLIRDYVGNTAYSASGTFLHDQDPTLAYIGPVEIKLDHGMRTWNVAQILWVPDASKGEGFNVTGGLPQPQRFTATVSGHPHEYLFNHPWDASTGYTVYMQRASRWQPVAAICLVGHISGGLDRGGKILNEPSGEFAGLNAYDGCFWNDSNGDGIAQRSECTIVPAKTPAQKGKSGQRPLSLENGWGGRMGRDLSIYSNGIIRYKPLSYSDDGAPIYRPQGMSDFGATDQGDLIPLEDDGVLLCLSSTGYGQTSYVRGLDLSDGHEVWRYPSYHHGVHGSHHATMPEPGRIIGALKISGAARINDEIGSVFAIRGNLGEDYLMTADGMYVSAIFRDSRLPGPSLPAREQDVAGKPVGDLTEGGEPFNGWFGRQSDGKVRMLTGIPGQAGMIVEVHGLDTIRRFKGASVDVSLTDLVRAEEANGARANAATERKRYTVKRVAHAPTIDGSVDDWRNVPAFDIARKGFPERAHVRLGYDDQSLYVMFEVTDSSPWKNAGKDFAKLFKTGDGIDLQLCSDSGAKKIDALGPSHSRLLFAPMDGKPVCVLMRPVDPSAPPSLAYDYHSPVGSKHFDRVELLSGARVAVKVQAGGYRIEAAIPLQMLGLAHPAGQVFRGDAGFISSDGNGQSNVARTYWSNAATNLTNDMPSEAWLYPAMWGEFAFE